MDNTVTIRAPRVVDMLVAQESGGNATPTTSPTIKDNQINNTSNVAKTTSIEPLSNSTYANNSAVANIKATVAVPASPTPSVKVVTNTIVRQPQNGLETYYSNNILAPICLIILFSVILAVIRRRDIKRLKIKH